MPALDLEATNTVLGVIGQGVIVGGAVLVGLRKYVARQLEPIRRNTRQLEHNGGSHVADYARDARDASRETRKEIADLAELVDDAAQAAREAARTAETVDGRLDAHMTESAATTRLLYEHLAAHDARRHHAKRKEK